MISHEEYAIGDSLTFHCFVEGTIRGHVSDNLNFKRIFTVLLTKEGMHIVSLVGIANSATNAVNVLEELFSDVTADIPVHARDKDEGAFGDCWHSHLFPCDD
jgi:hypothetical protein